MAITGQARKVAGFPSSTIAKAEFGLTTSFYDTPRFVL